MLYIIHLIYTEVNAIYYKLSIIIHTFLDIMHKNEYTFRFHALFCIFRVHYTLCAVTVSSYRARLEAKLKEVLGNTNIDESRILTEAAIFADKVAVDEEIVRLRSHFTAFEDILASNEPVGRKLDFLMQEMNRETNTIGSKCSNSSIAHVVVDIKCELEKIREQIQNIE